MRVFQHTDKPWQLDTAFDVLAIEQQHAFSLFY
jgi:hypothetical protein